MSLLRIDSLRLVGGGRTFEFDQDFAVVKGSITTGKTTTARLLRALLGRVPAHLPPETSSIRSLQGHVRFFGQAWEIDRPLTSTPTAIVTLARVEESPDEAGQDGVSAVVLDAIRLPAEKPTATEELTYQEWILTRLGIPAVSVPRARSNVASVPTPVTINDWLLYCIVRDDQIDTEVFGHRDQFIDRKRRAVFELNYGLYSEKAAELQADLRSVELRLASLETNQEAIRGFLLGLGLGTLEDIDARLDAVRERIATIEQSARLVAQEAHEQTRTGALRKEIGAAEEQVATLDSELRSATRGLQELRDLRSSLQTQSNRLTRAIVANEWLVDFDFVVCPRCGTGVSSDRSDDQHCYLCLQEPDSNASTLDLVAEQDRVAGQIVETSELMRERETQIGILGPALVELRTRLAAMHTRLEQLLAEFVSVQADAIAAEADMRARLQSDASALQDYRAMIAHFGDQEALRSELEGERADLADALGRVVGASDRSEVLLSALEERLLDYLQRIGVKLTDRPITAALNRTTYLPVIDGRPFDELSSQGLSVLVNVAHALAHHTVSLDYDLALPSLLVLDGVSNNVGHEGFDLERRDAMYQLLLDEVARYEGRLQVIAFDNEVPEFAATSVVEELSPTDRLVRNQASETVVHAEPE